MIQCSILQLAKDFKKTRKVSKNEIYNGRDIYAFRLSHCDQPKPHAVSYGCLPKRMACLDGEDHHPPSQLINTGLTSWTFYMLSFFMAVSISGKLNLPSQYSSPVMSVHTATHTSHSQFLNLNLSEIQQHFTTYTVGLSLKEKKNLDRSYYIELDKTKWCDAIVWRNLQITK